MKFSVLAVKASWLPVVFPLASAVSDWLVGVFPWLAIVFLAICRVCLVELNSL